MHVYICECGVMYGVVRGAWCMVSGVVHGEWCVVCGEWCGAWCVVCGAWCVVWVCLLNTRNGRVTLNSHIPCNEPFCGDCLKSQCWRDRQT